MDSGFKLKDSVLTDKQNADAKWKAQIALTSHGTNWKPTMSVTQPSNFVVVPYSEKLTDEKWTR